jgi:hypothetical protein
VGERAKWERRLSGREVQVGGRGLSGREGQVGTIPSGGGAGDIHFNSMTYMNLCEGLRPDVRVLSAQLMTYPW